MNTFGTSSDSLGVVMDLNDAMKTEFEKLMVSKYGSVHAYFVATGEDKRNFYKVLSRSPQIGWINTRVTALDSTLGEFFDAVQVRLGQ